MDQKTRTTTDPRFQEAIRNYRIIAGLSQNKLARQAGVDPAYINRIERGQAGIPSRSVVLRIIEALGLTPYEGDKLLVFGGHCPEAILKQGGWVEYLQVLMKPFDNFLDIARGDTSWSNTNDPASSSPSASSGRPKSSARESRSR